MITASTPRPREKRVRRPRPDPRRADRSTTSAPKRSRQLEPARVEIDAQHAAAVRAQQLHGQQADQAEAGDHDRLAERRLRRAGCPAARSAPSTVKAAASSLTPSGIRAQRFTGTLTTSACLPLDATRSPTAKPSTPAPTSITTPDVAVAERQRLIELVAHGFERRHQAVRADLVEHHAHLVRLLARLVDQAGLAEIDQHALGAGRDQRAGGADEHVPSAGLGDGTSASSVAPVLRFCRTCFMLPCRRSVAALSEC